MARRPVGRGLEAGVAKAAVAAAQERDALAGLGQIGQKGFVVIGEDLRARRHAQHGIATARTRLVGAAAVLALVGPEMLLIAEIDQRVEAGNAFDDDIAATAAVAAPGPAVLDEFFAPEGDAAVAAVAGLHVDLGLIEEFHGVKVLECSFVKRSRVSRMAVSGIARRFGMLICCPWPQISNPSFVKMRAEA